MPQLGETVAEGKITKWFKSAGDAVKPGDNLFEIETDKTSMEVPATVAGTLTEIRVQRRRGGAKVGAVVAMIAGAGERGVAAPPATPSRPAAPAGAPAHVAAAPRRRSRAAAPSPRRLRRSSMIRSTRCARPSAITARRSLPAARSSRRWRAGSRPKRGIDLSRIVRLRSARPHRRARRREGAARRRRVGSHGCTGASCRAGQGAVRGRATRRCRSTACAHHRDAAGRGQADHPAFLSDRRCRRSAG